MGQVGSMLNFILASNCFKLPPNLMKLDQVGFKLAPSDPIWPQVGVKLAQVGPKLAQVEPGWLQIGFKLALSSPKLTSNWRQVGPSCPKVGQVGFKLGSSSPKLASKWRNLALSLRQGDPSWPQVGSSWAEIGHKLAPTHPKFHSSWMQVVASWQRDGINANMLKTLKNQWKNNDF